MSAGTYKRRCSMSESATHRCWPLVWAACMFLCSSVLQAGPVNINTADAATLAKELKGVGLKRAEAIVEYRQKHGPFKSADELALVKGIGPAAVAKNRELIRIEGGGEGAREGVGRHRRRHLPESASPVLSGAHRKWPRERSDVRRVHRYQARSGRRYSRWRVAARASCRPPRPAPRKCCRWSTSR